MAAPLAGAVAEREEGVRVYMPVGELIPGMGYLVRRLLENSSTESFLRRSRAAHDDPAVLLADPARCVAATAGAGEGPAPAFASEPPTDFALADRRARFAAALAAVRARFGQYYPLLIGDATVETSGELLSRNPSRPAELVGRAASAGAARPAPAAAGAPRPVSPGCRPPAPRPRRRPSAGAAPLPPAPAAASSPALR